jgi:hypothetical protein
LRNVCIVAACVGLVVWYHVTRDPNFNKVAVHVVMRGSHRPAFSEIFSPPAGATSHYFESFDDEDGAHRLEVITAPGTSTPLWILLTYKLPRHLSNEEDQIFFKVNLEGKLERVLFGRARLRAEGFLETGAWVEERPVTQLRVQRLFKNEIKLWRKWWNRKARY